MEKNVSFFVKVFIRTAIISLLIGIGLFGLVAFILFYPYWLVSAFGMKGFETYFLVYIFSFGVDILMFRVVDEVWHEQYRRVMRGIGPL